MLISDDDALKRLNSSMNLCFSGIPGKTQGKSKDNAMNLFVKRTVTQDEVKTTAVTYPIPAPQIETEKKNFFGENVLIPAQPEESAKLEHILNNSEAQIKLGLAHDSALNILTNSMHILSGKLDDVKAEKLPAVITAAAKVVEGIRKERNEANRKGNDKEVHYHFYTPNQKKVTDYAVIDVTQ